MVVRGFLLISPLNPRHLLQGKVNGGLRTQLTFRLLIIAAEAPRRRGLTFYPHDVDKLIAGN